MDVTINDLIDVDLFTKFYKELAKDGQKKGVHFLITYHLWDYVLINLNDEQKIAVLSSKLYSGFVDNTSKVLFFDKVVSAWKEFIVKKLEECSHKFFTSENISVGEAIVLADAAFDKYVGYANSFFKAFVISVQLLGDKYEV